MIRFDRTWAAAAAAACLALAGAGCQSSAGAASPPSAAASQPPAPPVPSISITPTDGSTGIRPDARVAVRASNGRLVGVTLRSSHGAAKGVLGRSRAFWHSAWALRPGTSYTVRARARDAAGHTVVTTSSFHTLPARKTFDATIFEGNGETYGVGMPVTITFSQPVVYKRSVERALELWSSKPVVGSWYWDGDETLYFRTRGYWPPNTRVRFVGHLTGVEIAPGVYGTHTLIQRFRIGRSLIAVASTTEHHVQIYLDRRLYATWPISSGRPGDDTPNGTYLTIEKGNPVEMKGPGYDLMVPWSVRFTWSGDYMHDAYWSVGEQGFTNVSHGCVNLSPANAETYYNMAVPGDPVTVTGSPRGGTWGNGWTVWFLTWHDLLQGSALHKAVRVGPTGSTMVAPGTLPRMKVKPPIGTSAPGNADAG